MVCCFPTFSYLKYAKVGIVTLPSECVSLNQPVFED
jgi:hypothetical protein